MLTLMIYYTCTRSTKLGGPLLSFSFQWTVDFTKYITCCTVTACTLSSHFKFKGWQAALCFLPPLTHKSVTYHLCGSAGEFDCIALPLHPFCTVHGWLSFSSVSTSTNPWENPAFIISPLLCLHIIWDQCFRALNISWFEEKLSSTLWKIDCSWSAKRGPFLQPNSDDLSIHSNRHGFRESVVLWPP